MLCTRPPGSINNPSTSLSPATSTEYTNHTCNTHSLVCPGIIFATREKPGNKANGLTTNPRVSPGTAPHTHRTFSRHSDRFHHHWSRQHSLGSFGHKLAHRDSKHSHGRVRNHRKTPKAGALASAITALVSKWRDERPSRAAGTRALAGRSTGLSPDLQGSISRPARALRTLERRRALFPR